MIASKVLCSHVLRELVNDVELPGKDEALGAILGLSDPACNVWVESRKLYIRALAMYGSSG